MKLNCLLIALFFGIKGINAQEKIYEEIGITEQEIDYLNQNQEVKILIDEFLKEESTEENKIFIKDLIGFLIETNYVSPNYTEENYPGKEDGLPFEWWKEPEKYTSLFEIE